MTVPIRVLIGESNLLDSQLTLDNLGRNFEEIEATTVECAEDFIAAIDSQDYDVVITDNRLSGFRDLEAIEAIRSRNLKTPLIFLAERGEEEILAKAIKHGVTNHLVKTENYGQLIPAIVENALLRSSENKVRRMVETELHQSERRLRMLLDEMREPVTVIQKGRVALVNSAFAKLVGAANKDQVIDKSLDTFIHSEELEKIYHDLRMTEQSRSGIKSRKIAVHRIDGDTTHAMLGVSRFDYKGRPAAKIVWRQLEDKGLETLSGDALKRLQDVIESAQELADTEDAGSLGPQILDSFSRSLNVLGGSMYLREEEDRMRLVKTLEKPHQPQYIEYPPVPGSVLDKVFADGSPVFVYDFDKEPGTKRSGWDGYRDNSLMVITLKDRKGEIKGMVSLHNKRKPPFDEIDEQLGCLLANYSRQALKNIKLTQELEKTRQHNHILSEESLTGIAVMSSGRIEYANPRLADMLGQSDGGAESLVGMQYRKIVHPQDWRDVSTQMEILVDYNDTSSQSEIRLVTKTGKTIWAEVYATPISHQGRQSILCNFIEITEKKRIEEARRFQSQILAQISDWVTVTDNKNRIVYASPSVYDAIGLYPEDVIGKSMDEAYGECLPYGSAQPEELADSISGGGQVMAAYGEGEKQKVIVNLKTDVMVDMDGERIGLIHVARNVTREEELEAQIMQSQKIEVVGALAGGLAHDFNNLLTGITGYIQIAMMNLDPEQKLYQHLQRISLAANRTRGLTRRMLAFSRKHNIDPQIVNLNDEIDSMENMLGRLLGKQVRLKAVKGDISPIKVDPVQIEQIIMNLAVNARDAMPHGGNLIIETGNATFDEGYCRQRPYTTPGDYVQLTISDTGIGMDEETRNRIFEPFFTTKPKDKGTGLGMSTVYTIVKQQRGFIEVESAPDAGTSFKLYFPCAVDVSEKSCCHELPNSLPNGDETILMVEDENIVGEMNVEILSHLGYTVHLAENVHSALRIVRDNAEKIDLLMTAVAMPGMSGRELARQVREWCPDCRILYTSGYTEQAVIKHGAINDGDPFIAKPYDPEQLANSVRVILDSTV